ncbi:hypothetical protein VIGAN_03201200 [Vigna angularis var. angularis]|uniref:BZIP domain-containing protein n=2 Tax=Phaseolus angularis TaxID=3914 RepID=A0A0S3RNF8_PHAAN|nr:hypothetical protein VIGAN_03201200 [Vigna angularis var. angularis]
MREREALSFLHQSPLEQAWPPHFASHEPGRHQRYWLSPSSPPVTTELYRFEASRNFHNMQRMADVERSYTGDAEETGGRKGGVGEAHVRGSTGSARATGTSTRKPSSSFFLALRKAQKPKGSMWRLQGANKKLVENIKVKEEACAETKSANNILRAQTMELTERLCFLNSILEIAEEVRGFSVEIPDIPDPLLKPWQIPHSTQPIMATANMFLR